MKLGAVFIVAFVFLFSPAVHGAETDVLRVFDENLKMTKEEMLEYLKEADLENNGFSKTVEVSTETDENGKTTKKKTIYYRVTDDCSKVMFWESVLEQRLPEKSRNSKIFSTTVKEIQSRITGRKTKSCTIGLEVHPNRCLTGNNVTKRGVARRCLWCVGICINTAIVYDN